jgi:hypothetical protein
MLVWHKHKWRCRTAWCSRKVFTEALPEQIPARARITCRARRLAAEAIGEHGRLVSGAAAEFGFTWNIAHAAFIAHAEKVLGSGPPPVTVLEIDETRRGRARWESDPDTGIRTWVDRFDTGLVDLSGSGGLFCQVNGRNSKVVIDWIEQQDQSWRERIEFVSMGTSATYARAACLALANAQIIVDRFYADVLVMPMFAWESLVLAVIAVARSA